MERPTAPEKKTERKPAVPADKEKTFLFSFARGFAFLLSHVFFPVRYHHKERLTHMRAPALLMSNHVTWMDPLIIGGPVRPYEVRFLGKHELAHGRFLTWFTRKMHMISVRRHESDIEAMRTCSRELRTGHVLGIFPEGTRHQPEMMQTVELGASLLALREKVPILPVYIDRKFRLFRVTDVYVGEWMDIDDLCAQGADRDTAEQLSGRIRATFYAMRDEARREQQERRKS